MSHRLSGKEQKKMFSNACLMHDMHIRVNSLERDAASAHIMLPKFPIGNP